LAEALRGGLQDGAGYAVWAPHERFNYVRDVIALLSQVPSFQVAPRLGSGRNSQDWQTLLRWWLAKSTLPTQPPPKDITNWYQFVSQNFVYRSAWGLGSVLGLLLDLTEGDRPIRALEIDDWPRSDLPWIAFWLKELLAWGTLEPVAAFLLARGGALDRPHAEADARAYYDGLPQGTAANDILDPRRVRDWLMNVRQAGRERRLAVGGFTIRAVLARPPRDYRQPRLTVMPLESQRSLVWIDPAGYTVARSERPRNWPAQPGSFEFELDVARAEIVGTAYLPHMD